MKLSEALQIAKSHHRAGRLAEAERIYRQVLTAQPNEDHALMLLGVLASQSGRPDDAANLLQRALAINPALADGYNNLGNVYRQKNMMEEAIAQYRMAIAQQPDLVHAHFNLGVTLCDRGRFDQAAAALREAIRLQPDFAGAYNGLGNSLSGLGKFDEANASFERSIALSPQRPEFHWNYAINLLSEGDFQRGWEEMEWRLQLPRMKSTRHDFKPAWDGADLAGKKLLVWTEGGFGDVIHFIRYIPMVADRGGEIILECQAALIELFRQVPGVSRIIPRGEAGPDVDAQVSLQSLPHIFRTTLATIPARIPYLAAPAEKARFWKDRLPKTGRKIGLVWAGHDLFDTGRSGSIEKFSPLLRTPQSVFVSLQKNVKAAAPIPPEFAILDFTDELHDFTDTAGLIANLDLVISVDTAVAHLAGAMARPTWTLLATTCDFRWLRDRPDSPWYPTMRLFRQKTPGDWGEIITRVNAELESYSA